VFFNERGSELGASTYFRVWQEARVLALTPEQVASPVAGKPYDLRHAALSTWLNSGVDPTEVAERGGNSVEVLLSRYAKCLHGRDAAMNRRIEHTGRPTHPSRRVRAVRWPDSLVVVGLVDLARPRHAGTGRQAACPAVPKGRWR
jgi:hypothetical protein